MILQFMRSKKVPVKRNGINTIKKMLDSTWDLSTQFPCRPESPDAKSIAVFNLFFERLNQVVITILKNVVQLSALAPDLFLFSRDFRKKAGEQELKISGIVKAGETMADQIRRIAENTQLAADDSQNIQEEVQAARDKGESSMERFIQIKGHVNELVQTIKVLDENSKSIKTIIDVINKIADETNILSLNARIEAARTNTDGKGFKVIAEEIAALAKQSKEATANIQGRLSVLAGKVNETVTAVHRVEEHVAAGEKLITDANLSLQRGHDRLKKLTANMAEVKDATMLQADDVKSVSRDITDIGKAVKEQTLGVDKIFQIAEQVNETCDKMIMDTGIFHLTSHNRAKTRVETLASDPGILSSSREAKEKVLTDYLKSHRFVELAYITDAKGRQVTGNIYTAAIDNTCDREKGFDRDWSQKEWFQKPATAKKTFVSKVYRSSATGRFCFTIAVPIFKARLFSGVLGIDINFRDILEI